MYHTLIRTPPISLDVLRALARSERSHLFPRRNDADTTARLIEKVIRVLVRRMEDIVALYGPTRRLAFIFPLATIQQHSHP